MLAYVGLGLETENTVIPHIWFGIAAARILRKVRNNRSRPKLSVLFVGPKANIYKVHNILIGSFLVVHNGFVLWWNEEFSYYKQYTIAH